MRVTFRATEGPMVGKEFVLRSTQLVRVGRTEWADVSLPDDTHMSSIHFEAETDLKACYIRDHESTNGTFLNGKRTKGRQVVCDGDIVVAGDTSFSVRIEGGDVDAAGRNIRKTELAAPGGAAAAQPAPAKRQRGEQPPPFTAEKCGSGLTLCRGEIAAAGAADVALRLCDKFAAHLIVDFRRLGQPPPKDLCQREYLFDWFNPAIAALASPLLISQHDLTSWPELLEAGWGKDAVVCVFSNEDRAEVWRHLRQVCRVKARASGPPTAVLGFCWPSVLVSLLSHHAAYSSQLLEGLDAVLTEFPDLPDTWQLYGKGSLPDDLDALGFDQQRAEAPAGV